MPTSSVSTEMPAGKVAASLSLRRAISQDNRIVYGSTWWIIDIFLKLKTDFLVTNLVRGVQLLKILTRTTKTSSSISQVKSTSTGLALTLGG